MTNTAISGKRSIPAVLPGAGQTARRFLHFIAPSDSMAPNIQPGDVVEIDTAITRVEIEGIYLVDVGWGSPELKRVQRIPGDGVSVWADKAQIKETVSRAGLRVLGRAVKVWSGKRV